MDTQKKRSDDIRCKGWTQWKERKHADIHTTIEGWCHNSPKEGGGAGGGTLLLSTNNQILLRRSNAVTLMRSNSQ